MIDLIFYHGTEVVIIKIKGNSVTFGSTVYGAKMADISGLKLDYSGTIKEFPDLKDSIDWKEKAIERFKKHIKSLKNEEEISSYLIKELVTKGYTPKLKQKQGFRPVPIPCGG